MNALFNPTSKAIIIAITLAIFARLLITTVKAQEPAANVAVENVLSGRFQWQVSPPLLSVDADRLPESPGHPWLSVKDPSIVRYDGQWHLFCSLRRQKTGDGRIHIGYLSFSDWKDAPAADWSVLKLTDGYHGAPQIFFFEPHDKWYLIYQAEDATRDLKYGPCYSTNDDISKPSQWTLPQPLYTVPEGKKAGLDFWVICDQHKAYLFFTSLNGRMWRCDTALSDFPDSGWSEPQVVYKGDIFEASHTYKLRGLNKYLTVIEAQNGSRRYFKAFIADRLDAEWKPLAASRQRPFASPVNVVNQDQSWSTSYSHGEIIRSGIDQNLEIDPEDLQFVFQGVSDADRAGIGYGDIPWKLGILRMTDQ